MDDVVIVPRWLNALLRERFYESCEEQGHNTKQKNIFCLSCRTSICRDCKAHANHRLLKTFTYGTGGNQSYVIVKLDNANELLDCSGIQTRFQNGTQMLFINQRPQTSYRGNNCERDGCNASLEHYNSFCSIECKINHIMSAPSRHRNARWLLNKVNLP